jgi:Repeat of unknown function (DUF5648)/Aerolysin toxin
MSAGDHLYTADTSERDSAVNKDGYHVEGFACYVCPNQVAGTTALTRLYNPQTNDHLYTTSETEVNDSTAHHGYLSEGTACFIFVTQEADTFPLYRLYNGYDHFYTASEPERLVSEAQNGYRPEGIVGYVYLTSQPETAQPFWRLWNKPHPLNQASSVVINRITYDTANAIIQHTDSLTLYSGTVRNGGDVTATLTKAESKSVTDTSGWSDTITASLQASTKFSVGQPVIAGGQIQVTASLTNTFAWNGSESHQTEWSWSLDVPVPAKSSVHVTVAVSQSTLIVPYTTSSTFSFPDGSSVTCDTFGTYTGVASHDQKVDISLSVA